MVRRHKSRTPGDPKDKSTARLRTYHDISCPYCGSNIYWGTQKCRRCGKRFPEELANEIDRRTMLHYIPLEYSGIQREQLLSNIIMLTLIALIMLVSISALIIDAIFEDIRTYYLISWAFFVCTIASAMFTIFYLADTRNKMLTTFNLLFTIILIGTVGFTLGFVGLIQVAVFNVSEFELLVCAIFIVLSAVAIAGGRQIWAQIAVYHFILIGIGTAFVSWSLMKTVVSSSWGHTLLYSGYSPFGTAVILLIGLGSLIGGTYVIFHETPFNVRLNNCYPTWFAGMAFLALFTFFRAALFRPDMHLTYLEALFVLIGLLLTFVSLILLLRKKMADNSIQSHLRRINRGLDAAERLYQNGDYDGALERYEKLLMDNPCLPFGKSNDHWTLELLGIDFVQARPKPLKDMVASDDRPEDMDEPGKKDAQSKPDDGSTNEPTPDGKKDDPGDKTEKDETRSTDSSDASETEDEISEIKGHPGDDEEEGEEDPELIQAEALALLKKSTFYEKAGQSQRALACIERSLKLDRSNPDTWIRLGHLISRIGGSWDRVTGFYDWVVEMKLKAIQEWVESEDVPSQYTLWLLEELASLKKNLRAIGKTLRALKSKRVSQEDLITRSKKRRA